MSNIDDTLIITIAIQTHGKVITYELDGSTTHIFEDVMLLCKAGGFVDYFSEYRNKAFNSYMEKKCKDLISELMPKTIK